jgi:NADH-quinone oxidoreductase subunit L
MILLVTGVGLLIHVYAVGYMEGDEREDRGFQRFFCFLNLFVFAMLVLVLADNLVLMFLGWEGVSLCSYLLIGFWYGDSHNAYCGTKAFVANRIGDVGFLTGTFLLFWAFVQVGVPASLAFSEIAEDEWLLVDVVGICFLFGACGKSAQIPLQVWLPDAMTGPTPVSALIHAATMVTAGVYLVCRLSFLYAAAPLASAVVAWTGCLTAIVGALSAISQTDIKKVLAYSTVSQLGTMFLAAGCGGFTGAMFHLVTHAFAKALLFLAAGSVILAMHHEQDIERMGGLGRRMWQTKTLFFVGVFVLSGFPPASVFFSKDEILLSAYAAQVPGHEALYWLALSTAALTAFYLWRLHFLVFWGDCRAPSPVRDRIREQKPLIVNPLWILAGLALVAGVIGIPQTYGEFFVGDTPSHSLNTFLEPGFPPGGPPPLSPGMEYALAGGAVAAAGIGLALAWWIYVREPSLAAGLRRQLSSIHQLVARGFYVDTLYDVAVVRPLVWVSDRLLYRGVDAGLIDAVVVNGTARGIRVFAADGLKHLQSGLTQEYVFVMIVSVAAIIGYLVV